MYRKHLREQQEMESKTGIKTIDRISEIPVVNSALHNVTDYYGKFKESNAILRTSFNLAELSVKTMAFAATPITSMIKKPIDSVDSYLYGKLNDLEKTYPTINKPTEQVKEQALEQAKVIYNKTVLEPIDNIKEKTTDISLSVLDACLENKYAKLFTNPLLDLTEKSLDYWLEDQEKQKLQDTSDQTTIRRLFDINNRVYNATFQQLNRLHRQFESTIDKLKTIKDFSMMGIEEAKDRIISVFTNAKQNTLVSQCANFINQNKISLHNLEELCRNRSSIILADFSQMIEKYMGLVKNFPLVFNGSKIRQNIDILMNQLKKESFGNYLSSTIEQLTAIHQALLTYTNQMFHVVYDLKLAQLFKRIPSKAKDKTNIEILIENNEEKISSEKFSLQQSLTSTPNQSLQTPLTSPPPSTTPIKTINLDELNANKITLVPDIKLLETEKLDENLSYSEELKTVEAQIPENEGTNIENEETEESDSHNQTETTEESSSEDETDDSSEEEENSQSNNDLYDSKSSLYS
ncbi:unnamed protein product [Brachionus calyciflorus]|uniref:Perilipin n=1 Tax=Brachionus calyciflorus TaxID=104777 RepID=A0A814C0J6_9BILA|nr:unnamed protein product [Brachionus calyciflorus]